MGYSRTKSVAYNAFWGCFSTAFNMILSFISRTVFIYTIGVEYLGINALYANILGVLCFSELGIGTAIIYSLYKPIASGSDEKIQALMGLYKTMYYYIAFIILILGILLIPVLPHIVTTQIEVSDIIIFYSIFLFNTVSSYLFSYKYGFVYASQKNYIISIWNSLFNILVISAQIFALLLFREYVLYLITQAVFQLIQKIGLNFYLNSKFPILCKKADLPLPLEEYNKIKNNVKSLIIHKIGEVSIYQTDNIIISYFINVAAVGILSNYNLVISTISGFIIIVFNSVTSSLGNLIATENKEKQYEIFEVYTFLAFWIYGCISVCLITYFQPFITLWIGSKNCLDFVSVTLILCNTYMVGQRLAVVNMKTAGGIFSADKYVSLVQGGLNLLISLILVQFYGLLGIFAGTVISGLFSSICMPWICIRRMFPGKVWQYFKKYLYFLSVVSCTAIVSLYSVRNLNSITESWYSLTLFAVFTFLFCNLSFSVCCFRFQEFNFSVKLIKKILPFKNL